MPEVHLHGVALLEARRRMIGVLEKTTPPARTFALRPATARHERARIRDKATGTVRLRTAIVSAIAALRAPFWRAIGVRTREYSGLGRLQREAEAPADRTDWTLSDYLDAADRLDPAELERVLAAAMAEQFDIGAAHAEAEIGVSLTMDPLEAKAALERWALEFSVDVADGERAALKALLHDALDQGLSAAETANAIADHFADGVHRTLDDGSVRTIDVDAWANAVARTEIARAQNSGILTSYGQAGVTTIMWLAADDERTCPKCVNLDGQTAEIGTEFEPGVEQPPDPHVECRCTVVAADPQEEGDQAAAEG